ncbi:ATP-binding cassette domain-containing protein [Paenibacillus rhizoplanae]
MDYEGKQDEIDRYLKMLDLDGKVSIDNGRFSTLKLSGGQRKRLALLICYLEDRPIYLFDEWAADQDPEFRKFFSI